MAKNTIEQVKEKIYHNTLETCIYISGYENQFSTVKIKCLKHNYQFETKYENVRRSTRKHHVCPYCLEEDKNNRYKDTRQEVTCAYCGKTFIKPISKLEKSKSGLYFCCRKHKDLAQQLNSGQKFDILRPDHYGKAGSPIVDYRLNAFRNKKHECQICGWADDEDILEVHHIDENRQNNSLKNLMILCPICHRKITSHKYKIENQSLVKI